MRAQRNYGGDRGRDSSGRIGSRTGAARSHLGVVKFLEGGRAWCGWLVGFVGFAFHGAVRVAERSRGRSRLEDEERKVGGDAAMVGPNGQRLKVQERHE